MSIELYVKDRFSTMNLFLPFLCSAEDKNMILHYLSEQDFEEEEEKIEEEEEVEEEEEPKDTYTPLPLMLHKRIKKGGYE